MYRPEGPLLVVLAKHEERFFASLRMTTKHPQPSVFKGGDFALLQQEGRRRRGRCELLVGQVRKCHPSARRAGASDKGS
jgi:hypothetical protein